MPESRTILAVDDEPIVLSVVANILRYAGYEVLTAPGDIAAIDLCTSRQNPIHLLLTDISTAAVDGAELASRISSLRKGVPVLFMTGHAVQTAYRDAISAHPEMDGNDVIYKPFTSAQLTERVRQLLAESEGNDSPEYASPL